ncbi:MAG: diguanylate cyclase [Proteobacteria bacterium]|nr:diguanylate cyclase [Pseudomonadota bacterium]
MVSDRVWPLEVLIGRLAAIPIGESLVLSNLAICLDVLEDTVQADAFALLKASGINGAFSVFAGRGLAASPERIPPVSFPALALQKDPGDGKGWKIYSLEGPFADDPFLSGESARNVLFVPFGPGEELAGILAIRRDRKAFTQSEGDRLASIAHVLRLQIRSGSGEEEKAGPDIRDPVTGLGYFPLLLETLGMEISRSRRGMGKVTLGILSLGRGAGSGAPEERDIKWMAGVMKAQLRDFDTLVRYSRGELAFILPDAGIQEVFGVMDRIFEAASAGKGGFLPSVHVGLSSYPEDASTMERLIETAEAALNQAREKGDFSVSRWNL